MVGLFELHSKFCFFGFHTPFASSGLLYVTMF
jgi:hypothetical protein